MWPAVTSASRFLPSNSRIVFSAAAVDRVDQLEILHAEVVFGVRLDEHFLDRRRGGVAARLGDRHRRRLIGQHVDRVLRRRRHALARRRVELDAVEAVLLGLERRRQRAVGRHRQAAPSACRRTRICPPRAVIVGMTLDPHFGALEHGDVAAVLDLARREPGVGREVDTRARAAGRTAGRRPSACRSPSARRRPRRSTRSARPGRTACLRTCWPRWVLAADQRHALERRPRASCGSSATPGRPRSRRACAVIVWSAPRGTRRVAGRDLDAVRRRRLDAARDHEAAPTARGAGRRGPSMKSATAATAITAKRAA